MWLWLCVWVLLLDQIGHFHVNVNKLNQQFTDWVLLLLLLLSVMRRRERVNENQNYTNITYCTIYMPYQFKQMVNYHSFHTLNSSTHTHAHISYGYEINFTKVHFQSVHILYGVLNSRERKKHCFILIHISTAMKSVREHTHKNQLNF